MWCDVANQLPAPVVWLFWPRKFSPIPCLQIRLTKVTNQKELDETLDGLKASLPLTPVKDNNVKS